MQNKLSWLGFLGLIGIAGLVNGAPVLAVFLVFFFFFSYARMVPDELFMQNMRRAAHRAFWVYLALTSLAVFLLLGRGLRFNWEIEPITQLRLGTAFLVVIFIVTVLVFFLTLMIYAHRERRSLEEDGDAQDED